MDINFFARELQQMLAVRGFGLGAIDDCTDVHRQTVHRLQKSLSPPGSFHMLNPDDLNKVIKAFSLTPLEIFRLRAAVVANAIMKLLCERIPIEHALAVAEQVYTHVLEAMKKGDTLFSRVRIPPGTTQNLSVDEILEGILPIVDRAMIALHMSMFVPPELEIEYLWQARSYFESAQQILDEVDSTFKATDAWKYWHSEMEKQLANIEEFIDSF